MSVLVAPLFEQHIPVQTYTSLHNNMPVLHLFLMVKGNNAGEA